MPFSDSYSTICDDLCSELKGIATRSQWEGSRKQKNENHALNQIGIILNGGLCPPDSPNSRPPASLTDSLGGALAAKKYLFYCLLSNLLRESNLFGNSNK